MLRPRRPTGVKKEFRMATQTVSNELAATGERFHVNKGRLARGLGWFSLGLGLAELVSPENIASITGTRGSKPLIRAYGVREIAAGVGILAAKRPGRWVWTRVAGDAVDLATLGKTVRRKKLAKAIFAIASVAGVTALDVVCAAKLQKRGRIEAPGRASA